MIENLSKEFWSRAENFIERKGGYVGAVINWCINYYVPFFYNYSQDLALFKINIILVCISIF